MNAAKVLTLIEIAKPIDNDCDVVAICGDEKFRIEAIISDENDKFERVVILELARR